jgi:exopolysaccharide biosynthesis polyprenyl glycosylphosphotransferase
VRTHERRSILLQLLMGSDLLIALCSWYSAAYLLRVPGLPLPGEVLRTEIQVTNLFQFIALLVIWHISFVILELYHSRRLSRRLNELADVVKAVTLAVATIYILDKAFQIHGFPLKFAAVFWATATVACTSARLVMRFVLRRVRVHGRNLRHLVIVGSNKRAVSLARKIEERPWLGFHFIGFVDEPAEGSRALLGSGHELVASLTEFGSFISTNVVDEVIICLPFKSYYQQAARLASLCEEQGIIVRVSSDIFDLQPVSARSDNFEGNQLVTISVGGIQGGAAVLKNLLDRLISVIALVVLAPVLTAIAIAVKLTSPGPALFAQKRWGLNKRAFNLYKFRTMVVDAEARQGNLEDANEASGPVFKIRNDPRITPLGRFLRKYSLDELPQLLNVLKGEMSLVGPRPLPVRDCQGFNINWHRRRFSVRPGLSCLWQISGRSSLGFEDWMRLDMQYIDQWSLWLDLKIIAKTLRVVVTGAGAW